LHIAARDDIVPVTMRVRLASTIAGAMLVLAPGIALAGPVTGYGETDYEFTNRRDCCQASSLAAQDDGATKCRARGGVTTPGRSVRGSCETTTGRDGHGRPIHACESQVKVDCR
jgi:hypothetical protein